MHLKYTDALREISRVLNHLKSERTLRHAPSNADMCQIAFNEESLCGGVTPKNHVAKILYKNP